MNPYDYEISAKQRKELTKNSNGRPPFLEILCLIVLLFLMMTTCDALDLPGADQSSKLKAAGTLLRIIDNVLFSWGARLMAGLSILGAAWNLKNQAFGLAIICVIAAIIVGTAPMWVKNIFEMGGGGTIFSMIQTGGFYV